MKKILLVLAMIASLTYANAQSNDAVENAIKAINKAKEQTENPKKADKPATWMKLAKAYIDAYNLPTSSLWLGASQQELALTFKEKPSGEPQEVSIGGQSYVKVPYENKDLYFNSQKQIAMIVVTKPVVENALGEALKAYKKAHELDPKGKENKKISEGIILIKDKYVNDAYNAYNLQNNAEASKLFEDVVRASQTEPYNKIDTSFIYNAAFTAWAANDLDRANKLFKECLDYGYYYTDGEVFAKLGDIAGKQLDTLTQQKYLEEGFIKFPQSQPILISLINFYIGSNGNQDRLFELLETAKKNEPTNVSLYYVEGNIHEKLGQYEQAIEAYRKCAEINPEYEFGWVGEGILNYNRGVSTFDEASKETDDAKYMELYNKFEEYWKKSVEPFEKAFELTKNEVTKTGISEYLKNVCFRFRTESAEWMDKYNKYNDFFQANQGK